MRGFSWATRNTSRKPDIVTEFLGAVEHKLGTRHSVGTGPPDPAAGRRDRRPNVARGVTQVVRRSRQVWEKNMTVCHKPSITANKSEDFTQA